MLKKKNSKIAVVTVVYKKGLPFLKDYFSSLDKQEEKDFDLLLFNSDIGAVKMRQLINYVNANHSLNYKIINLGKHPISLLWTKIIHFLIKFNYSKYIFADFDDYFDPERVGILDHWLNKEPLVFHDLNLFFSKTGKIVRNYFAKLIPPIIDWKYLLDKNCIGLGNSAVRREILFPLRIPKDIKVVDWYLFVSIMLRKRIKARFIPYGLTYYRQHFQNIACLTSLDGHKISFALKTKYLQYKYLIKNFKNSILKHKFNNTNEIINFGNCKLYFSQMRKKYLNKKVLWWQYAEV